ncbi:MAG: hypothetical protein ACRC62_13570 [Microcoleus sp.]
MNKGSKRVIKNLLPLRINGFGGGRRRLCRHRELKVSLPQCLEALCEKATKLHSYSRRESIEIASVDKSAGILYQSLQES